MDGLEALIDAVGGITVNNAFEFTAEDIHYPEGTLELEWLGRITVCAHASRRS